MTTRWLGAILIAVALTSALTVSSRDASASHDYSNNRHFYNRPSVPIPMTFRNQIGPAGEGPINHALAAWASTDASNRWPAGPARSDFAFTYAYGGAASCDASSPVNETYCLR